MMMSTIEVLLAVVCAVCALAQAAELRFEFAPGCKYFSVSTGNSTSVLRSGETFFTQNGKAANLILQRNTTESGVDAFGEFKLISALWADGQTLFYTNVRTYPSSPNIIIFSQKYAAGAAASSSGNKDGVQSAFPSFKMANPDLGYAHFSGVMGGGVHDLPQFGVFDTCAHGQTLAGGMQQSGAMCLFTEDAGTAIVISPLNQFMSSSLYVQRNSSSDSWVAQWGVMGGAQSVPAGHEASWIMAAYDGGVNHAMRSWGALMLSYYGKDPSNAHSRDLTLQYLGFSTDNGAYYYYYPGSNWDRPNYTYQDTIANVKRYADAVHLPYAYVQLDSWWYYQSLHGGLKNWTARPDIFPDGMKAVHKETGWPIQAHSRYWSLDNVYASNPQVPIGPSDYNGETFEFTWGPNGGLPHSYEFWDNLFTINSDWGLHVYEQDWLSTVTNEVPALYQNVTFGQDWLTHMGRAAEKHGLSIQYCMGYPRHILTSLLLNSVTQARASNDYQPESIDRDRSQWNTADSALWMSSIGIAPSKDNFWSMPTSQFTPHYTALRNTSETRNRLESMSSSMGNGPVQPSDRIGFSDVSLILKCCAASGVILRPATSWSPIDRSFVFRSFQKAQSGPNGAVHLTYSAPPHSHKSDFVFLYTYLSSVNLLEPFNVTVSDLLAYHRARQNMAPSFWLAFEANTTDVIRQVEIGSPLQLQISDEWSFEFYTLVPIFAEISLGWYVQGEVGKWIGASEHRFTSISVNTDGSAAADIIGSPSEAVEVYFVNAKSKITTSVTCVFDERQRATARISSDGSASC
jgi:hypothetical protein